MVNIFKECLKKLKELNLIVTVEDNKYLIKEVNIDNIIKEIPCNDPRKEHKLLDCYYEMKGL